MKLSIRALAGLATLLMMGWSQSHAAQLVFDATLDASQVVAGGGSTSTAIGSAVVTIDTTLFTVTTDLTWSGLSGPADRAHLHNALSGQVTDDTFEHEVLGLNDTDPARTVLCPWVTSALYVNCAPATGSVHDVLTLSATDGYGFADFNALIAAFEQGDMYIDMHTELYPSGEIRGQFMPAVPEPSTASLVFLGIAGIAVFRRYRLNGTARSDVAA